MGAAQTKDSSATGSSAMDAQGAAGKDSSTRPENPTSSAPEDASAEKSHPLDDY